MVNYRAAATGMRYCLQVLKRMQTGQKADPGAVDERIYTGMGTGERDKRTKRRNKGK